MNRLPAWFWAVAVLVLVLVFNLALTPGFFHLELRDGRLYGSLIDILNRAAPVGLLSLGMTLVIATGGVDLSVGALMAIAGTIAAGLIARPAGTLSVRGTRDTRRRRGACRCRSCAWPPAVLLVSSMRALEQARF